MRVGSHQVGLGQVGPCWVKLGCFGSRQVRLGQAKLGQVASSWVRFGWVGSGKEEEGRTEILVSNIQCALNFPAHHCTAQHGIALYCTALH